VRDYITNTTYVKYKYEKNPHNSPAFSGLAVRSLKNLDRAYKTTGALLSKALLLRFKAFSSASAKTGSAFVFRGLEASQARVFSPNSIHLKCIFRLHGPNSNTSSLKENLLWPAPPTAFNSVPHRMLGFQKTRRAPLCNNNSITLHSKDQLFPPKHLERID
jgi:hypothetical protein